MIRLAETLFGLEDAVDYSRIIMSSCIAWSCLDSRKLAAHIICKFNHSNQVLFIGQERL